MTFVKTANRELIKMVMENVTSPEEEATGKGDKRRILEVVEGPNVGALPGLRPRPGDSNDGGRRRRGWKRALLGQRPDLLYLCLRPSVMREYIFHPLS